MIPAGGVTDELVVVWSGRDELTQVTFRETEFAEEPERDGKRVLDCAEHPAVERDGNGGLEGLRAELDDGEELVMSGETAGSDPVAVEDFKPEVFSLELA